MKILLAVILLIVLALDTMSFGGMIMQLSLILIITMIFLAYENRERRIHKLKEDVWRR